MTDDRLKPENLGIDDKHYLNPNLVVRQNVDDAGVDLLKRRHAEMEAVKARFSPTLPRAEIDGLIAEVARIEYLMQDAWGFQRSASHHTHWRMVPGCKCPLGENDRRRGIPSRVIADDCPYHSTAHPKDVGRTYDGTAGPVASPAYLPVSRDPSAPDEGDDDPR